jgi:hypothetical protein
MLWNDIRDDKTREESNYYYGNTRLTGTTTNNNNNNDNNNNNNNNNNRRNNNSKFSGSYSFSPLLANTEYDIKIKARNKFGWSENEPAFVFKTSNRGQ